MSVYLGKNKVGITIKSGIKPEGEIEITENGTHDVTNYASAVVNIASSGGGTNLVRCAAKIVEVDGMNELQIDTEDLTNGEMFLLGAMMGENDSSLQNLYLVNF